MTYTNFTEIHDTGKTKVWSVDNANDGSHLGKVRWHGAWRKYVFQPIDGWSIWSADCLRDVADFLQLQMAERRRQRSNHYVACPACGQLVRTPIPVSFKNPLSVRRTASYLHVTALDLIGARQLRHVCTSTPN